MKEKLSAYMIELALLSSGAPFEERAKEIYRMVEADREAIRAETREELLQDHFKIGEEIYVHSGTIRYEAVVIAGRPTGGEVMGEWAAGIKYTRRTPKKRAMTREEKIEALQELNPQESIRPYVYIRLKDFPDYLLDGLCQVHKIPTEVDE